jgi:hypothetical protein
MNFFFEGPWPILITGLILEAILVITVVRTGRGAVMLAIAGVGLAIGGMLVLERAIVTESEQIRITFDDICAQVVAGNLDGVLAHIDPSADKVRQMVTDAMRRAKFREAKVHSDLSIRFSEQGTTPYALANFTGSVKLNTGSQSVGHDVFLDRFKVGLLKRGDRWLVVDLERVGLKRHD